jgi:hypothetical protein
MLHFDDIILIKIKLFFYLVSNCSLKKKKKKKINNNINYVLEL